MTDQKPDLMPRDWRHTGKCLAGVSRDKCICWPPTQEKKPDPRHVEIARKAVEA